MWSNKNENLILTEIKNAKFDIELPFKSEHIETYCLPGNLLLIFSESWDYIVFDGNRGRIIYQGKFPEDENQSSILSICSYWFRAISHHEIIYYSPTHEQIKVYDFELGAVTNVWTAKFRINLEFNFFNWMQYYPDQQKCRILHMTTFSTAAVTDVYYDGTVAEIGEV